MVQSPVREQSRRVQAYVSALDRTSVHESEGSPAGRAAPAARRTRIMLRTQMLIRKAVSVSCNETFEQRCTSFLARHAPPDFDPTEKCLPKNRYISLVLKAKGKQTRRHHMRRADEIAKRKTCEPKRRACGRFRGVVHLCTCAAGAIPAHVRCSCGGATAMEVPTRMH